MFRQSQNGPSLPDGGSPGKSYSMQKNGESQPMKRGNGSSPETKCIHHYLISSPAPGEHEIGVCKLCGEIRDFTGLQMKDRKFRELLWAESLIARKDVSMERIMADRTLGGKRKKPRGRPSNYSRGRVG